LKRIVIINKKALQTISQCVFEANNNFETGGVLIGYGFYKVYFVLASTTPSSNKNSSKISFLLDGAEHTRKANDIISSFKCSPNVLGVWHTHICDGHKFSERDKISNRILAKSLGGALAMLITQTGQNLMYSASYISTMGVEQDCVIKFQNNTRMEKKHVKR